MPELPEVETIRAFLDERVRGKAITAVEIGLPRLIKNTTADRFAAALTGQTLEAWNAAASTSLSLPRSLVLSGPSAHDRQPAL